MTTYYNPGTLKGERTFMNMKVGQLYVFPNCPHLGPYRLKRVEKPPMFGGRRTGRICGSFVFESVDFSYPQVREPGSGWVADWEKRLAGDSCI